MTYLVDTTFAIDLLNQRPYVQSVFQQLGTEGYAISILTYTELWEGVYTNRDPKRAAIGLRAFLGDAPVLLYSRRVAQRAARLRGQMRAQKLRLDQRAIDILIAATALQHDLTMLTSDTDYDDIPGLTRLNPRTGYLTTNSSLPLP